jgi:hypothetical protein
MATRRASVQKREREQKKRERQFMKAAKAAEKRASRLPEGDKRPAVDITTRKDEEPC